MRTLKYSLEKPSLIWLLIAAVYVGIFWTGSHELPLTASEQTSYNIIEQFAESSFPPKIHLIRELPDWGGVGFYALYGRAYAVFKGDAGRLRAVSLALVLLSFIIFIWLGRQFTYRNRLNPLWISLALLVLAANPYSIMAAFRIESTALFLLLMLLAMHFFEREKVGWSAIFVSAATLIDFRALLLAVAFGLMRITGERSRLLRPERMIAFILPFVVAALPLMVWQGPVPQGEAQEWWKEFFSKAPLARPGQLFYLVAAIPLYAPFFSWSWGLRARSRALATGAILTAVLIIPYFLFPIHFDYWDEIKNGTQSTLGLIDEGALFVAGPYKNLLLFVPWLGGMFLLSQLLLMDVLDRSRWLRYFIIFFFLVQPFVIEAGDREFLAIVPPVLLLSLSEALVGEEGKLA